MHPNVTHLDTLSFVHAHTPVVLEYSYTGIVGGFRLLRKLGSVYSCLLLSSTSSPNQNHGFNELDNQAMPR
jgi:hypothetical protein